METPSKTKQPQFTELKNTFKYFPFTSQKQPILVLILIGFIFYCTTLKNEYALDDGIIIHQNDFVIEGVSGLDSIIGRDAYRSFYKRMNAVDQLSGGRYRPLSVVSFAIEQEFIGPFKGGRYPMATGDANKNGQIDPQEMGCHDLNQNGQNDPEEDINEDGVFNEMDCQVKDAPLRHFNNMWTFILGCLLFYLVLRDSMFRDQQDIAFLSALIFLTHPLHTEAIANVKSRDEIFSLIFISLTYFFSFRLVDYKNYFGQPSFITRLTADNGKLLFGLMVAVVGFFVYILFGSGKVVYPFVLILAALILYRSYNGFMKRKQYTKGELLLWATLSFFFAMLSKEYAITLLGLIPLGFFIFLKMDLDIKSLLAPGLTFVGFALAMLYMKTHQISFVAMPFLFMAVFFVFGKEIKKMNYGALLIGFYAAFMFYWALRLGAVVIKPAVADNEILNNPYLLANGEERFCTKVFVLLKYFTLAWFPHPLSSDYSFNSILYRHFTSWDFWLSLAMHLTLVYFGIRLVLKRHPLGYAIAVYIAFLLMVGNIIMDIGATMGERLLFHSTIGFAIGFAWLIIKGFDKLPSMALTTRRIILFPALSAIIFLYGCKAWERNWDWKNDISLFLKDAVTMPNSVLVLGNAGARWIDLSETKFFNPKPNDVEERPPFAKYEHSMLNFEVSPAELADGVNKNPFITMNEGDEYKSPQKLTMRERSLYKGIGYLKHATGLHPRYVNGYLNLGLAYMRLKRDKEALFFWKHAEKLYPNNPYLQSYYQAYYNDLMGRAYMQNQRGRYDSAAVTYQKANILSANNPETLYSLGAAFFNLKKYNKAKEYWDYVLRIKPDHAQAKAGLSTLVPVSVTPSPVVK